MSTTDKLAEAIELAEDAMAYVPEYFANKHGMNRRMAALKEAAAHDAEQSAKAVPAGFVLVPVEPTPEMLKAAHDCSGHALSVARYHAMLAAAPTPPAPEAAKAVPALYVGLIERLMRLSARLGIAYEGGVEHFAASLEDRLYAICRGAESLLNSVATPPAPEAQQPAGQEQDERAAFEAWAATYSTFPLERDDYPRLGTTSYTQMEQTMLWDAWQARAALAQRREPLTASQVNELCGECNLDWHCGWAFDEEPNRYLELARAIEKHHGIGATTGEQR